MEQEPDIKPILDLQRFLIDFRNIKRMVYFPESDERENDVEHSFFLAVIAWQLAEKVDPSLDMGRIMQYALVHDLVEVHAGDTFAFGEGADTKHARELESLGKIKDQFSQDFPSLTETIEVYEQRDDRESRFVYAVDKMLPAIMESFSGGRTWLEEGVTYAQVYEYDSKKTAESTDVQGYFNALHDYLSQHPEFFAKE
ncbi:MAG: HD domain-containing protein [Candidatus Saccharimonadales bacterium]